MFFNFVGWIFFVLIHLSVIQDGFSVPLPQSVTLLNLLTNAANSYQYTFAMNQAVKEINNAGSLNTSLIFTTINAASNAVTSEKSLLPYLTDSKRISNSYGIIFGDKSSGVAEAGAWYAMYYNLSMMLTSATATALYDKSVYPNVTRVVGADMSTANGFVSLMKMNNWNRIALIVSADELGLSFVPYFLSIIPPDTDYLLLTVPASLTGSQQVKYIGTLLSVINVGEYRVILIMATPASAGYVVKQAIVKNMLGPGTNYTWFVGSSYCSPTNIASLTSQQYYQLSALICIIDGYDTPDNLFAFRSRMTSLTANLTTANGLINFQTDFNYAIPAGYDAIYMIAAALQAINSSIGPRVTPLTLGSELFAHLYNVNITGPSSGKQLFLNDHGETINGVDYLQLNLVCNPNISNNNATCASYTASTFKYIGSWSATTNQLNLTLPIVWPNNISSGSGLMTSLSAPLDYFPTYPPEQTIEVSLYSKNSSTTSGIVILVIVLIVIFVHKTFMTFNSTLSIMLCDERSSIKKTAVRRNNNKQTSINNKQNHEWFQFLERAADLSTHRITFSGLNWLFLSSISQSLLVILTPYTLLFLFRELNFDQFEILYAVTQFSLSFPLCFMCVLLSMIFNIMYYRQEISFAQVQRLERTNNLKLTENQNQIVSDVLFTVSTLYHVKGVKWMLYSVFFMIAAIIVPFHMFQSSFTLPSDISTKNIGYFLITPTILFVPTLHFCVHLIPVTMTQKGNKIKRLCLSLLFACMVFCVYTIDSQWYTFKFNQSFYNKLITQSLSFYLTIEQLWIVPCTLCGYGLFFLMGMIIHRQHFSKSVMDVVLASNQQELSRMIQKHSNMEEEKMKLSLIQARNRKILTFLNSCRPGIRPFALSCFKLEDEHVEDEHIIFNHSLNEFNTIFKHNDNVFSMEQEESLINNMSLSVIMENVIYLEIFKDVLSSNPTLSNIGPGCVLIAFYLDLIKLKNLHQSSIKDDISLNIYETYLGSNASHPVPGLVSLLDNTSNELIIKTLLNVFYELSKRLEQYYQEKFVGTLEFKLCCWIQNQK